MRSTIFIICLFATSTFICIFGMRYKEPVIKNHFKTGLKLFADHCLRNPNQNFVISPSAIESSIYLLLMGVQSNADKDILDYFQAPDPGAIGTDYIDFLKLKFSFKKSKRTPQLLLINQIYLNYRYTKAVFRQLVLKLFETQIYTVSFRNRESVASYLNNLLYDTTLQTMSKKTVPSSLLKLDTQFLILNALHLRAKWKYQFSFRARQSIDFISNGQTKTKVLAMTIKRNLRFADLPKLSAVAFELPYAFTDATLLIVAPKRARGLKELERKLSQMSFKDIVEPLQPRTITVFIPKFSIKYAADMADSLSALGLKSLFNNSNADGNILPTNEIHAANFDINELGTHNKFRRQSLSTKTEKNWEETDSEPMIVLSHPFVIFVYLPNALLFAGHVVTI